MSKYKITFKKFFWHLHTVNEHRFKVFCLSCKVGIPLQGLVHDFSKYYPEEFLEGVRYYQGNYSPIRNCKNENGYSRAWLHHKGRNKHHYEYWYDYAAPNTTPIMPFKYFLEMICDSYAAGMTYHKKDWNPEYQLNYWNKVKDKANVDKKLEKLLDKVYLEGKKQGLNKILNKKYLKELYDEYINVEK